MWKWVKFYMADSRKNPVGLIHMWAREAEEQHLVQCQGVLGSTRLCGPTEEHAQRSKEPGGVCQSDSASVRDLTALTPLTPCFSACPWMTLSAVPRGCHCTFVGALRSAGCSGMTFKAKCWSSVSTADFRGGCGCSVTHKFWQPPGNYTCTNILCVHMYWSFIWNCLHGFTRMEELWWTHIPRIGTHYIYFVSVSDFMGILN